MAHIRRHPKTGKWQVRYLDPTRRERSRTFARKVDAEAYLHEVESTKNRGEYINPDRAKITTGEWASRWMAGRRDLKPSTRARDRSYYRNYIKPNFESVPLADIEADVIEAWIAELVERGLAAGTVRKAYGLLNRMLASAVRSRRLSWNPASVVEHLPRLERREMRFLTPEEIVLLADSTDERYRAMVLVGGYCGLRFGEAAGLRVERFDELRRSLAVVTTITEVAGDLIESTPKTSASVRKVALPQFLARELSEHINQWSDPEGWIFPSPEGGPIRRTNWRRRFWLPAVEASVGSPLRFHDLRHSHAAMLIAQGEHVKVIADRLGHANPVVTMTTYAHLFDGLDIDAADRLDDTWAQSVTDPRRTQTVLAPIPITS